MTRVKLTRPCTLPHHESNRLIAFRHAAMLGFACCSLFGCAKNHYYIEPNGQVTSVSHQPFFGLKKNSPETVQMAAVPTEVQGAKVITVAPSAPVQSAQVGVVNPAIPEAVVVQPPANQGVLGEPPLINGGSNGTQVSGGIRSQTSTGPSKVAEGLLD
ncbi:hypothetical protein GC170_16165 [bacterium]|nr:hypothetical protein [bacterium]